MFMQALVEILKILNWVLQREMIEIRWTFVTIKHIQHMDKKGH